MALPKWHQQRKLATAAGLTAALNLVAQQPGKAFRDCQPQANASYLLLLGRTEKVVKNMLDIRLRDARAGIQYTDLQQTVRAMATSHQNAPILCVLHCIG